MRRGFFAIFAPYQITVVKQQPTSMKKKSSHFDKFTKKKSNAAIKEEFKQEKRKVKKEREEYFDKKKAEVRSQRFAAGNPKDSFQSAKSLPAPVSILRPESTGQMPLNKYIAHSGVAARREAAEMVKKGLVKVNGEVVTSPGHKVASTDD